MVAKLGELAMSLEVGFFYSLLLFPDFFVSSPGTALCRLDESFLDVMCRMHNTHSTRLEKMVHIPKKKDLKKAQYLVQGSSVENIYRMY